MNETQIEQLIEYLRQAVELGKTELPLVAAEICQAGAAVALMGIVFGVLVFAAGMIMGLVGIRSWGEIGELAILPGVSALIVGLLIVSINLPTYYKATYTPRAYIVEYLR